MALTEIEKAFVTLFTPTLDEVWGTCKIRESHLEPGKIMLHIEDMQLVLLNVYGNFVEVFQASERYFPEFAHGTASLPAVVPLVDFITAINTMAKNNSEKAVQARHRMEMSRRGL